MRFDVDAFFISSDDVRDDMAEAVLCDLLWSNFSTPDHLCHQRVVVGQLMELAVPI